MSFAVCQACRYDEHGFYAGITRAHLVHDVGVQLVDLPAGSGGAPQGLQRRLLCIPATATNTTTKCQSAAGPWGRPFRRRPQHRIRSKRKNSCVHLSAAPSRLPVLRTHILVFIYFRSTSIKKIILRWFTFTPTCWAASKRRERVRSPGLDVAEDDADGDADGNVGHP